MKLNPVSVRAAGCDASGVPVFGPHRRFAGHASGARDFSAARKNVILCSVEGSSAQNRAELYRRRAARRQLDD
jgi:hypothetical protein